MSFEKNMGLLLNELRAVETDSLADKSQKLRIALQAPEGLKTRLLEIAGLLEKEGYDTIILADPCYGACDLRIREAVDAGAELIVHIGHRKFVKEISSKIPILYIPWKLDISIDRKKIELLLKKIKEKEIAVASSLQYEEILPVIKEMLESNARSVKIIGPILGCSCIGEKNVLFVGSGNFHALAGCSYVLDIEKNELRNISDELMVCEKKRYAMIEKAKNSRIFGILVSSKPGQNNMKKAMDIRKMLEQKHKKAFILIMDEITKEKLMGIKADCFINTACPRIIDSIAVLNMNDIDMI